MGKNAVARLLEHKFGEHQHPTACFSRDHKAPLPRSCIARLLMIWSKAPTTHRHSFWFSKSLRFQPSLILQWLVECHGQQLLAGLHEMCQRLALPLDATLPAVAPQGLPAGGAGVPAGGDFAPPPQGVQARPSSEESWRLFHHGGLSLTQIAVSILNTTTIEALKKI
jgi:hypothetical protein